jgi:hypothetical protein
VHGSVARVGRREVVTMITISLKITIIMIIPNLESNEELVPHLMFALSYNVVFVEVWW